MAPKGLKAKLDVQQSSHKNLIPFGHIVKGLRR